jgi:hypothetical protein
MFVILGALIITGCVAWFWYLLPAEGRVNPVATLPVLESVIPITITGGIAVGFAFVLAGLFT